MENNNKINPDILREYVSSGIQKAVEAEFDIAIKRLNEKKNEICAGVLLNVMKVVDMEKFGDKIIFTVRELK